MTVTTDTLAERVLCVVLFYTGSLFYCSVDPVMWALGFHPFYEGESRDGEARGLAQSHTANLL